MSLFRFKIFLKKGQAPIKHKRKENLNSYQFAMGMNFMAVKKTVAWSHASHVQVELLYCAKCIDFKLTIITYFEL